MAKMEIPVRYVLMNILFFTAAAVQAQEAGPSEQHIPRISTGNDKGKGFRIVSEEEARRLVSIPSRPGLCRVCRCQVNIPMPLKKDKAGMEKKRWQLSSSDTDADLCPHPTGKIRFHADIPICLHCGFAAYQTDFMKPQDPAIKSWVQKVLTPNMQKAERQLLGIGGNLQMSNASFVDLFKQEDIPDVVRCHHALSYYITMKAPVEIRAKLAWLTAWAYRRELSGTVDGPYMMPSIQRVLRAIDEQRTSAKDMEKRITILAEMFEKKRPNGKYYYPCIDRQSIRILLAGAYNRVGLTSWAQVCLKQVAESARNRGDSPENDPWQEAVSGRLNDKKKEADAICQVIERIANVRLSQLEREQNFLGMAATLLRESLRQGVYSSNPEAIPSRMYLIGEFERRQERFLAAQLWLEAAKGLIGDNAGVELNAPGQLAVMKDYIGRLGLEKHPDDPRVATDRLLVTALIRQVQASRMLKQLKGKPEQIQTGGP